MSLHAAYQNPKPSQWLSQNAGVPTVKIAFTVGGTEGAKDLLACSTTPSPGCLQRAPDHEPGAR